MKPDNVTFEQAASVPIAAITALQGLRDKGHIQPGQKVLINGAGEAWVRSRYEERGHGPIHRRRSGH
jgi:D-arabinose 1-dehydrogenase-like Zn-dependent alcohol dehydrogenase